MKRKEKIRLHPSIRYIMKITFVHSMLICFGISVSYAYEGVSQELLDRKINLHADNIPVKNALTQIEQQAKVKFVYSPNTIGANRPVSISVSRKKLSEVLDMTLLPLNISYRIIGGQIMLQSNAGTIPPAGNITPDRQIKGKVTDSDGSSLPGVNILVKGTNSGTITDGDGYFSISVPDQQPVLVFSFIGYDTQEIAVGTRDNLDVRMVESEKALDEVIVVGYGKQSTRQVSSAVEVINNKDFADLPVSQFSQKLQGKLAGVQIAQTSGTPGAGMSLRVRGSASLSTNATPLYVVDGNPIVGDINNINPNEIESITVLKDAAATALYGSRAANGVVLIETKKAVPGTTRIDYSNFVGFQQIPQRGRPQMMNAREFATWRKEMAEIRGLDVDPEYQNPEQYGEGTNWYDALTQNALIQDHSLSLSTGTEKFSTTASAGFFQQDGVVIGSGYKRYSLRVNTLFRPTDKIRIGMNVAPTYQTNTNTGVDGVGSIFNEALQTSPLAPLRDANGNYTLTAYSPGMFPTPNYARTLQDRVVDNKDTRILANLFTEFEPIEGLFLKVSGNIDRGDARNFVFNGTTTGSRGVGLYAQPFSSLYQKNYLSWVNENTLTYQKNIGDHSFDVVGGITAQRFREDISNINGNNYADDKVQTISAARTITASSEIQEWSLLSYLARVNYHYKGKYLLSASIRRDGSSRFGAQNRWGNFPSLSLGWVMSEENFMADVNAVSFLKLRASFGIVGNFNIGNYTHVPTISTANYVFGNSIAAGRRVDNLADRGIGWETNEQFNLGLDLNLFNDKISFIYNYYIKNTKDLLFNVRVPRASGFSQIQTNIGQLKFWGHEFSLNSVNIKNQDLRWNTNFNISIDRNRVVSMGTSTSQLIGGPGSGLIGGSHITRVGHPIGMLYGMIHEGLYQNQQDLDNSPKHTTSQVGTAKFRDTNNDGMITVDDATIIGNPHPDFTFGMTNTLQYKNFDFSMTLSGTYGNDIVRGAEQTLTNLDGVFNVLSNVKNYWRSPENPGNGRYGSLAAGTTYLERDWWGSQMMYDASHLSINNVTIGYNIPVQNVKGLRQLRAYASVQQLHIFTKYPGSNPQVSISQTTTSLGIDAGSYPVPRTFSLGFNVGL